MTATRKKERVKAKAIGVEGSALDKLLAEFQAEPPKDDEKRGFVRLAAISQFANGAWDAEESWRRAQLLWKVKPEDC